MEMHCGMKIVRAVLGMLLGTGQGNGIGRYIRLKMVVVRITETMELETK